ncbi:MAG TPA: SMP-30/gluconolactonase/LRE family protein [Acidimicrobiales bacterium]|nr:SMP-30/gluconolactonase/LRE family protein [Acidimicrobiales bacterium]
MGSRSVDLVDAGHQLVEAPVPDDDGGFWFSDARLGDLYHRAADGRTEVVASGRITGGMVRHRDGGLVVSGPSIAVLRPDGSFRVLFAIPEDGGPEDGGRLTTFNDIAALPDGSVVGGTLRWPARPEGGRSAADFYAPDAIDGEVWRVTGEGQAEIVHRPVGIANGVEVHPDGETVYFADTKRRQVLRLRIADGPFPVVGTVDTSADGRPDGIAADADGCVWVAMMDAGVVVRYAPTGQRLEVVDIPARKVTSLAFEPTGTTLLVGTGTVPDLDDQGGSIFAFDAGVAGAPVPRATL